MARSFNEIIASLPPERQERIRAGVAQLVAEEMERRRVDPTHNGVRPPIHPGEVLADEMAERDVTVADVAQATGLNERYLIELLSYNESITTDASARIGAWLGTGSELWNNLQLFYDGRYIQLSPEDSLIFAEALLNPRALSERLRVAFARYAEEVSYRDDESH